MPELPEVETIVRDLAPRLTGRRFLSSHLHHTDVLRGVTRARLLRTLRNRRITGVDRRAKHIVLLLDGGRRLVIQPRMTGSLIVYARPVTADERRHVVLEATLSARGAHPLLVYRDVRRLGTIWLLDERDWNAYTARIGPEPLSDDFTADRFSQQMQGTRQAIKKALMDQRRLAGIGNIYANEALFRAGLDPSRHTDRLTPSELTRLHISVRDVLREAVLRQGTTFRDYRTGTGERGSFQHALQVYGRGGDPCRRCGGTLVTTHAIDGRATTFCWRCQR